GVMFLGDRLSAAVRRDIAAVLDREARARTADGDEVVPSDRYLRAEHLGYDPSLAPDDPVAARDRLIAAGPRELVLGAFASDWTVALGIRDQLAPLGITVRPTRFTSQSLQRVEADKAPLADAVVIELSTVTYGLDPYLLLRGQVEMVRSTGSAIAAVGALIDQAATEPDRRARQRLYGAIERAWRDDPVLVVLGELALDTSVPTFAVGPRVRGVREPQSGRLLGPFPPSFAAVWLDG
ncbi:MAG: hypothetical protein ABMB14_16995, partial [Myxococcota bacterium]